MKAAKVDGMFMFRLERHEPVIATLTEWCTQNDIQSAVLTGIGAVKNTEIGYYQLETREYFFRTIAEDREVASMTGNIALVDGKPFIHMHAVLSACDESLACVGGHIKECEVAVTLEIFLTPLSSSIERVLDQDVGLKLLNL